MSIFWHIRLQPGVYAWSDAACIGLVYLQADIEKGTIYGTWQADAFIVGPDSSGEFCHMNEIR
jgi:hypothetical protein